MVIISGPQFITSYYEPGDILNRDSFFSNILYDSGKHSSDQEYTQSLNSFPSSHTCHLCFHDRLEA